MNDNIKNDLEMLKGKKLSYIGRSCELIQIGFGEMRTEISLTQKKKRISQYALHIQCPFRITKNDKILFGYSDLFISSDDLNPIVDLDKQNSTKFDFKANENNLNLMNQTVLDVKVTQFGDIIITLDDIIISTFICETSGGEAWRFFETRKNKEHIVATCDGIELE